MITMKIWAHNHYIKYRCIICGERREMGGASCTIFEDKTELGDVCEDCLAAGPEAAQRRLRAWVEESRAEAVQLERIAAELSSLRWKRLEELLFVQREAEALAAGGELTDFDEV